MKIRAHPWLFNLENRWFQYQPQIFTDLHGWSVTCGTLILNSCIFVSIRGSKIPRAEDTRIIARSNRRGMLMLRVAPREHGTPPKEMREHRVRANVAR